MKKKFLFVLLAVLMVISMLTTVVAAESQASSPVAEINGVEYESLQVAIDSAVDGDTVKLLSNVEFNASNAFVNGTWLDGIKYIGDKSFTLDLNGYTISDNGELNDYLLNFLNKGEKPNEITIINGTISGGANLWNVISVGSTSASHPTTFYLGAGLIVNANGSGNNGEDGVVKVRGGSVLNILSGASIVSTEAMYCAQSGDQVGVVDNAILNIYDGAVIDQNMASPYSIAVTGTANVNIYGGTITSEGYGVHTSSSGTPVFTINGGNISGNRGAVVSCADYNNYPSSAPTVKIHNGTINGDVLVKTYGTQTGASGATMTVYNGSFDKQVDSDFIAPESEFYEISPGVYGVRVVYTISFEANTGIGVMAPKDIYENSYVLPECGFAAPSGKQFVGWQIGTKTYKAGDTVMVNEDITVTAKWNEIAPYVVSVEKTFTEGVIDVYTITFSDGSTTTFTVTNGKDGVSGIDGKNGVDGTNGTNGKDGRDMTTTPVVVVTIIAAAAFLGNIAMVALCILSFKKNTV